MDRSAFGVIHKTQMNDGTYKPISQMTPEERSSLRQGIRSGKRPARFKWASWESPQGRILMRNDRVLRGMRAANGPGTHVLRQAMGEEVRPGRKKPFKAGTMLGYQGIAGNLATSRGVVLITGERAKSLTPEQQVHVGIHEAAHMSTPSQRRKGKRRSPWRLATIVSDKEKLAREEARADGTTLKRTGKHASDINWSNSYEHRGYFFGGRAQDEYYRVRRQMGAASKFDDTQKIKRPPVNTSPVRTFKPHTGRNAAIAATGLGALGAGGYGLHRWVKHRKARYA